VFAKFGIVFTYVDTASIANIEAAITPKTRLIWIETPTNPLMNITDIEAVAKISKAAGTLLCVDNTFASPYLQNPLDNGADIVMHSATKYLGGHSDTLAGVLSGSAAMMHRIFNSEYLNIGSGISPFNAWLMIRGLRTLPMRLEHISKSTQKVLAYLKQHPRIEKVLFPFDESFPQYALAKNQMQGACGLMSFYLEAHQVTSIEFFCEKLQHIRMAVSWGGHESLIIPRCAGLPRADFDAQNPEHKMLRLYVGLEDPEYLISDLEQALTV
jgi:cystathionine beta-lyase/cystathionine gamma-synthase